SCTSLVCAVSCSLTLCAFSFSSSPHSPPSFPFFFFFNDTATTEIYTLSLHDALPIFWRITEDGALICPGGQVLVVSAGQGHLSRSEEHTSELQSLTNLVCRLLLEKKKKKNINVRSHNKQRERLEPHNS